MKLPIINRIVPAFMLLVVAGYACASSFNDTAGKGYTQSGKASFYANKFQSRKTASGELFDQSALTAAHKKLPFGSRVKVTNVENGKSIIVRINDRGPFVAGRIIDLSRTAFTHIGDTSAGVIKVKIEVLN